MSEEKKIKLNEQEVTQEELEQKKEEVKKMPRAQMIEVRPGEFKVRFYD